jgi:hypothetical protein
MSILQIVKKTVHNNRPTKVYDFTVENDHHYILSNGVISHNSYVPTKEMGGGSGLKYAASTIIYLSKKKEKNPDGDVIGNIIHCKLYKARFTKENQVVDVLLRYDSGLDRYYGLVDLALESGIFKKVSTRIELPDGSSCFEKNIIENPEKYFTKEIMDKLDRAAKTQFCYGQEEKSE